MRRGVVTMSDGYAGTSDRLYASFTRRSTAPAINKDKEIASFLINEQDVKVWKGRALRAGPGVDLHRDEPGQPRFVGQRPQRRDPLALQLARLRRKRPAQTTQQGRACDEGGDEDRRRGSIRIPSGAAISITATPRARPISRLGYLLAGIANQQYGIASGDQNRITEASDYYGKALKYELSLSRSCSSSKVENTTRSWWSITGAGRRRSPAGWMA
jgi:hypothetical protein